MRLLSICVVSLSVVCAPLPAATAERPLAVSPGSTGQLANLAESCPTFSWAGVPTASAYRLIVYEVTDQGSLGQAIVQRVIPGGATTWSAPLGQCLSRGGTYAWTVGASSDKGKAAWSDPVLFRIAPGPTETEFEQALAVVQSYLANQPENATSANRVAPEAAVADGLDEVALDAAPAAPAATQLSVDGNVDATSFTGDGSNLAGVATDADLTTHSASADHDGRYFTEAELATSGGGGSVDWTNVTSKPAGLDDGDDDTTCDGAACDGTNFTNVNAANADTVDGQHASAFMLAGSDLWVDETGDTMTGTLTLNPAAGNALTANADIEMGASLLKDGQLFLHEPGGNTLNNMGVGRLTLSSGTTGSGNTASGDGALQNNSTGSGNTAAGNKALQNNTTGSRNTASGTLSLWNNSTGSRNTASGSYALRNNSTGSRNTASGANALRNNLADNNTAGGAYALMFNTTGAYNTAAGLESLYTNSSGSRNTASGFRALWQNDTGHKNTAIGHQALFYNTTGDRNTGLGYRAGYEATTGNDNIFLGSRAEGVAGEGNTIRIGGTTVGTGVGQQNRTFINGVRGVTTSGAAVPVVIDGSGQLGTLSSGGAGANADTLDTFDSAQFLRSDTSDSFSSGTLTLASGTTLDVDGSLALPATGITGAGTGSGLDADTVDGLEASVFLQSVPTHDIGSGNTAVGSSALASNTTGIYNTASGYRALAANTAGNNNTPSGAYTLRYNTTGYNNTATGSRALQYNETGHENTANGTRALLRNTTGSYNTAIGDSALTINTTGTANTAGGASALASNTTGSNNTASGWRALTANTTGYNNTASGVNALWSNTMGYDNTASGVRALRFNTTGSGNTACGGHALRNNTTGNSNTAVGGQTLESNTTGHRNIAAGVAALLMNTTGSVNTAIGGDALYYNSTGRGNTALGYRAGRYATTGYDNIFIGSGAEGVAGEGNTIRIGGTTVGTASKQQDRTFINGIWGVTTGVTDAVNVKIDSNGQLGTVSSSRCYKEDIESMGHLSERLLALRPVTFRYKEAFADGQKPLQFGLIAEEVAEVFPELVIYNEEGLPETVKYHLLSTLLLNELQKQALVNQEQTQLLTKLVALAEGVRDGP